LGVKEVKERETSDTKTTLCSKSEGKTVVNRMPGGSIEKTAREEKNSGFSGDTKKNAEVRTTGTYAGQERSNNEENCPKIGENWEGLHGIISGARGTSLDGV